MKIINIFDFVKIDSLLCLNTLNNFCDSNLCILSLIMIHNRHVYFIIYEIHMSILVRNE